MMLKRLPPFLESGSAICDFFLIRSCHRGQLCPLRHISGDRMIVCKHWLRGLCKKGDDCEFLHQYDMEKMPECYFYNKYGKLSCLGLLEILENLESTWNLNISPRKPGKSEIHMQKV